MADNDARAYLALKGWRDVMSPYMTLLAILGARGTPREPAARRLLDEAIINTPSRAWPVPILHYYRGDLTEAALLQAARTPSQQTDAHAFIGLNRLQAGDRAGAATHLQWARDHGSSGSIASDVARAMLVRIGSNSQ
jgi:hypothetical protein